MDEMEVKARLYEIEKKTKELECEIGREVKEFQDIFKWFRWNPDEKGFSLYNLSRGLDIMEKAMPKLRTAFAEYVVLVREGEDLTKKLGGE